MVSIHCSVPGRTRQLEWAGSILGIVALLILLQIPQCCAADPAATTARYLGEEILLQGTNTDSAITYLFVTGPNLPLSGGRLDSPSRAVIDGDPASFTRVEVGAGNRWQYRWQTAGIGIDAGTYTVYAESFPRSRDFLTAGSYSTSTFVLMGPSGTVPAVTTVMTTLSPIPATTSSIPAPSPLPTALPPATPPATVGFSLTVAGAALLGACILCLRR